MVIVDKITEELRLKSIQVKNAVELMFEDDCTIPFVARYRKERTGSLNEVQLREIRDRYHYLSELESNKEKFLKVIEEHCQKSPELQAKFPELKTKLLACSTKQELDDLYLPFKPKRKTKAQAAKARGLEPFADQILANKSSLEDLDKLAAEFVANSSLPEPTEAAEAVQGAADILAERYAEMAEIRSAARQISQESGMLCAKKVEAKPLPEGADAKAKAKHEKRLKEEQKYQTYFTYSEPIFKAPPHRIMAIRRGEAEKFLRVGIEVDKGRILQAIFEQLFGTESISSGFKTWIGGVIDAAYRRLIAPAIETELRLELKKRAEAEAIRVFSQNLEHLLLSPPLPGKTVLGVDPGLRTGSKLAVVDATGKLLEHQTIFPDFKKETSEKSKKAQASIAQVLKTYSVDYIAVGNGTGGREINRMIRDVLKEEGLDAKRLFVNESGASVYSTDQIAREEFPDLDPTIRSAVSIARRLQDPLAELVKIDPRSIGVGQYQHDVNVNKLKSSLEDVVESCVNRVGVNLNSASAKLLGYVSGVGPLLAKSIVQYRDSKGSFSSRDEIMQISGLGPKVYQQSAGFLRVPNTANPLDNSAVHPESYAIVEKMAQDTAKPIAEMIGNNAIVNDLKLENYVSAAIGMPTLKDIASELIKPGRDPRADGTHVEYNDDVCEFSDLKVDMTLQGTVTNVTNFGAFVDIGVHQDGLVHISELSNDFVKDPSLVVSVGDIVSVRVIDVDAGRKRISLSVKDKNTETTGGTSRGQRPKQRSGAPAPRHAQKGKSRGSRPPRKPRKPEKTFTMDDLLSKFNKKV